jgi:hypothetical protein
MGSIQILDQNNIYNKLANILIRDYNDYYTLEDVEITEQSQIGKEVNLLFVIREVVQLI